MLLHISVCWDIKSKEKFEYTSLGIIFIGSAVLVAVVLSVTGVQYTFGRICYLIPHYDRPTFWGPLLAFAIASLILHFITMAYCIAVVIRPYVNCRSLGYYGSRPTVGDERISGAQWTASRVKKILQMQWRAILITLLVLIYVVFMAAILMQLREFHDFPTNARRSWFECLASSNGDKMQCIQFAESLGPTEPQLWAVLSMLIVGLSVHLTNPDLKFRIQLTLVISFSSADCLLLPYYSDRGCSKPGAVFSRGRSRPLTREFVE